MNKVLLIMGSPNINGNSNNMCQYIRKQLEKNNIPYTQVNIGTEKVLYPCSNCGFCSSQGYCYKKDILYDTIKNFANYKILIFFTPIYFFQFSGQTKVCIDRLGAGNWENKNVYLITASGSYGRYGGNDLVVESLIRTCEYNKCFFRGFYNKVTRDMVSPLNSLDRKNLNKIFNNIQEVFYNETQKN